MFRCSLLDHWRSICRVHFQSPRRTATAASHLPSRVAGGFLPTVRGTLRLRSPDYVRLQARVSLRPTRGLLAARRHAPPWTNMYDGSQSVDLIHALSVRQDPGTPLNWDDDSSSMIDETVAEIRAMRTHSTSAVAVKATRSLADLLDREYVTVDEFERDLEHNAGVLRRSNPPTPRSTTRCARSSARSSARRRASRTANSDSKTLSTASSTTSRRRRGGRRQRDRAHRGRRHPAGPRLFDDGA